MYNTNGIWFSTAESQKDLTEKYGSLKLVAKPPLLLTTKDYFSMPVDSIPTEIPLPFELHLAVGQSPIRFKRQNEPFSAAKQASLIQGRVELCFIPQTDRATVTEMFEAQWQIAERDRASTPGILFFHLRHVLMMYQREVEATRNLTPQGLEKFRMLTDRIARLVFEHPKELRYFIRHYQDPHLYYVNHAINVAVYAVALGKRKQLPVLSLKQISMAAVLHNLGNILIPPEVLYKRGELTEQEKQMVDSHTVQGAKLLEKAGAPAEIVLTAEQHHNRYDEARESANPTGHFHLFARICSVADVYDALTSVRPYQSAAMTPEQAVKKMSGMEGKFDPEILSILST